MSKTLQEKLEECFSSDTSKMGKRFLPHYVDIRKKIMEAASKRNEKADKNDGDPEEADVVAENEKALAKLLKKYYKDHPVPTIQHLMVVDMREALFTVMDGHFGENDNKKGKAWWAEKCRKYKAIEDTHHCRYSLGVREE